MDTWEKENVASTFKVAIIIFSHVVELSGRKIMTCLNCNTLEKTIKQHNSF